MPSWIWNLVYLLAGSLGYPIARVGSAASQLHLAVGFALLFRFPKDIIRKAPQNVKACVLIWSGGEQGNWSEVSHLAASVGVGSEMAEWLPTDGDEEKGSQPEILSREKRAPGLKLVVRKCLANLRASQSLA